MRTSYWSNSKFAALLRKISGIPVQPFAATMEEWDEYEKCSVKSAPIVSRIINFLDIVQNALHWIPDTYNSAIYKTSNVLSGAHLMKTTTILGDWSDLVKKIPDALFLSIIDFVEKECFWMDVMCSHEEYNDPKLTKYVNQSYLMRKLGKIKISDSERSKYGLKYLEFQIENSTTERAIGYNSIIEAYWFAKKTYFKFDAYEESGFECASAFNLSREECLFYYDKIGKLEKEFENNVTLHCSNIVKFRKLLWT